MLRCDACTGYPLEKVLPDDGTIRYAGLPEDRLRWDSETLRMTFTHPFCHPGRYCSASNAYSVRFVTPMSNVAEIHHKEEGATVLQLLPWAVLVDGLDALSFYGVITSAVGTGGWVAGLVGVSLLTAPALGLLGWTIATIVSPPSDEVVYPR
jgi:hypothetical protein